MLIAICSFIFQFSSAQITQDTIAISEVTINETKSDINGGLKINDIDTIFLNNNKTENISDILTYHTPVFIKKYGQGGLSSVSFRGTGAAHTQVLWNGININSPMLGQVDFSLIPVFFVDKLLINYGAASLTETSGGLGGSINLYNSPNWENNTSLKFVQSFGSFGTFKSFIRFDSGNKKWQSSTKILNTSSINNYTYTDVSVFPSKIETQQFSKYNSKGAMQDIYYRPNNRNIISLKLWWQNDYRDLPSLMTIKRDSVVEYQNSKTLRSIVEVVRYGKYAKLKVYGSFINENLDYTNKITPIFSINKSNTAISGIDISHPFNKNISVTIRLFIASNGTISFKMIKKSSNQFFNKSIIRTLNSINKIEPPVDKFKKYYQKRGMLIHFYPKQ